MSVPCSSPRENTPGSSSGPARSHPCSRPDAELGISPGSAFHSQAAPPGEGTRAGAHGGVPDPRCCRGACPALCPGTEQRLAWCLGSGEGRGRGTGGACHGLSILPGGFTPHARNALRREILENLLPCARLSWGLRRWAPCPLPALTAGLASGEHCHGPGIAFPPRQPGGTQPGSDGIRGAGSGGRCFPTPPSPGCRSAPFHTSCPLRRWQEPAAPCPRAAPWYLSGTGRPGRAHRTLLLPSVLREHVHGADE